MGYLGIAIIISTLYICDTLVFLHGYNSLFHKAKTDQEKEIQRLTIAKLRREAGEQPLDRGVDGQGSR